MKICALLIFLTIASGQGVAQEKFPSKPITIIIPYAVGGPMDLNIRTLQHRVEEILGQPLVIIDKAGANGMIGFTEAMKAAPDGYTIVMLNGSMVSGQYLISTKMNILRDSDVFFVSNYNPGGLVVKADLPWKSLKEFLDYAKSNPDKIRLSNAGYGSVPHLRALEIEIATGAKFTHVPYKGISPSVMAVLGGHAEGTATISGAVLSMVEGGKLRSLGLTTPKRMTMAPAIPTFKELGIDLVSVGWNGFAVRKGTPKDKVGILYNAFKKAAETPEYDKFAKQEVTIIAALGPEESRKFLEEQDTSAKRLIETYKIKQTN